MENNIKQNKCVISPRFIEISHKCSNVFLSNYFFIALFILACTITITQNEVIGAVIFAMIICLALIICDDIFATTLPFLLLCVFVTRCYDSFDIFIKFAPLAIVAIFSILFHFIVFKQKIIIGNTFLGLVAVSLALLCGGIGYIDPKNYFCSSSLYYTIFLGIGMTIFYLLFKSQLLVTRKYSASKKLATILYIMGAFACVVVLFIVYQARLQSLSHNNIIYQPSNNLSTFLLFALPCPFFFARTNRLHIISPFLFYFCILIIHSRGGILMGTILLSVCIILFAIYDRNNRIIYIITLSVFICITSIVALSYFEKIFDYTITNFFNFNDPRVLMMTRGLKGFPKYPIFGHGLGHTGNLDLYSPVKGAMKWYHMIIPQIVASLGIIGILAYGYQLFLRIKTVINAIKIETNRDRCATIALFLSYIGVLLMSQVNPGLFCPLPYSLIAVMIFAVLDGKADYKTILLNIKKR